MGRLEARPLSRRTLLAAPLVALFAMYARADGVPREDTWCVSEAALLEKLLPQSLGRPLVTDHMRHSVRSYIDELRRMQPVDCVRAAERRRALRVIRFLELMGVQTQA